MMPKKGQMCLKGKRREQNGDSLDHESNNCDKAYERCPGLCLSDQAASRMGIPGSQKNTA